MAKKKKKPTTEQLDEQLLSDAKKREEEKKLEDTIDEAKIEIEKEDKPVKRRGKFITFLTELFKLSPQIIGILKDVNVIKPKKQS